MKSWLDELKFASCTVHTLFFIALVRKNLHVKLRPCS